MSDKNINEQAPGSQEKEQKDNLSYVDCRGCEIEWKKSHE